MFFLLLIIDVSIDVLLSVFSFFISSFIQISISFPLFQYFFLFCCLGVYHKAHFFKSIGAVVSVSIGKNKLARGHHVFNARHK